MDILKYKSSKAVQKTKLVSCKSGFLTVINSKKNGSRIEFRKEISDKLGIEDNITVAYDNESAIFFKPIDDFNSVSFKVCKSSKKSVVYSSELVKELIKFFGLDFSNKVSYTFDNGMYKVDEKVGQQVLVIKRASDKELSNEINENIEIESEEILNEK